MCDVKKILEDIAQERPIFHSEADFQHALAWKLHKIYESNANVRLEFPIGNKHIDILIPNEIAIELKYKTAALEININNENFILKNHSAQDCGSYDFIKDITRLEDLAPSLKVKNKYAIFLTNDSSYWNIPAREITCGSAFRLSDNRELKGNLDWREDTSDGTKKGREEQLNLKGSYKLEWTDYSKIETNTRKNQFRYLCVKIETFTSDQDEQLGIHN